MNYLDPIQYHNSEDRATQTLEWAAKHGWSTQELTHNIMYNIEAIMSRTGSVTLYKFKDSSILIETPSGELL